MICIKYDEMLTERELESTRKSTRVTTGSTLRKNKEYLYQLNRFTATATDSSVALERARECNCHMTNLSHMKQAWCK